MLKRLHQTPHPMLERYALLFFAIAIVFTLTSFLQPWRGAYQQSASAMVGFASIFSTSVYELGSSSTQVFNTELNAGAAWDALTSAEAKVLDSSPN